MAFKSASVNFGASAPADFRVPVGVLPLHDDGQVLRVHLAHRTLGRRDVRRRLEDGGGDGDVLGDAHLRSRPGGGADGLHGEAVAEHAVVSRLVQARARQLQARRVDAHAVADLDEGAELIDGEDVLDAVGQALRDIAGVVGKRLRRLAPLPAAEAVLQGLRQVPVVERGEGLDAVGEQLVDEPVVEVEPLRVRLTVAVGEDARPRDGEAVRLDAERLHQLHVAFVEVIVVIGHVAVGVAHDLAGRMREGVPDGRPAPVLLDRALDLIRRGRRAPQEAGRERAQRVALRGGRGATLRRKRRGRRRRRGCRRERRRARDLCECSSR